MLKFGRDWDKFWEKICLIRQSRTKYSKQSKEIERNWKELENFDICFGETVLKRWKVGLHQIC